MEKGGMEKGGMEKCPPPPNINVNYQFYLSMLSML